MVTAKRLYSLIKKLPIDFKGIKDLGTYSVQGSQVSASVEQGELSLEGLSTKRQISMPLEVVKNGVIISKHGKKGNIKNLRRILKELSKPLDPKIRFRTQEERQAIIDDLNEKLKRLEIPAHAKLEKRG